MGFVRKVLLAAGKALATYGSLWVHVPNAWVYEEFFGPREGAPEEPGAGRRGEGAGAGPGAGRT